MSASFVVRCVWIVPAERARFVLWDSFEVSEEVGEPFGVEGRDEAGGSGFVVEVPQECVNGLPLTGRRCAGVLCRDQSTDDQGSKVVLLADGVRPAHESVNYLIQGVLRQRMVLSSSCGDQVILEHSRRTFGGLLMSVPSYTCCVHASQLSRLVRYISPRSSSAIPAK